MHVILHCATNFYDNQETLGVGRVEPYTIHNKNTRCPASLLQLNQMIELHLHALKSHSACGGAVPTTTGGNDTKTFLLHQTKTKMAFWQRSSQICIIVTPPHFALSEKSQWFHKGCCAFQPIFSYYGNFTPTTAGSETNLMRCSFNRR